ncbi:MAG: NUDIX hydrolase [Sumerlaeia bacterium]
MAERQPPASPPPSITRLGGEIVLQNPWFRVHRDDVRFPSGRQGVYWKVDYAKRGVGVVPIRDDGRVLLGLHYRYALGKWGWEIVAGTAEPGEALIETARRELAEETAHRARSVEFILDYHPAPGLGNEHFHIFFARGLEPLDVALDTDEIHELRAFSWEEIEGLIREGAMPDGFSVTALHVARARGVV